MLQSTNQQMKEAWTKDLEQILWEQAVRNKGSSHHTCTATILFY